jgi:hypothetical protein
VSAGATAYPLEDPGPYVVTFAVSFERMPLAVPFVHELDHFSVFRSHSIERGHSVFRQHVGYFDTQDCARAALRIVRRHYPDAHIATAPNRGLGSLDDTSITEFSVARPAGAGASAASSPAAADAPPCAGASACDAALQRYAIQLHALRRADASTSAPEVELLRAHTLYRIHVLIDGVLHQTLRLGFFPSIDAVNRVLPRIRDRYPRANAVPVSAREYAEVRDLVPQRGIDVATARAAGEPRVSLMGESASGPADAARGRARAAATSGARAGEDVSCEFGAHELPTTDRVAPYPPLR